ncbi:MAG: hypothetical protein AB1649_32375, partial [Chloroflexota bacterium]
FWQVLLVGITDGIIALVGAQSLLNLDWWISGLVGLIFVVFHWFVYRWMAWKREKEWHTRFTDNLALPQI